jgi:16S rRNA (adenine1518-N6/adenine1519-N6)-dimethyltransferase
MEKDKLPGKMDFLLKKYNIELKPDLDQHFMTDSGLIKKIVDSAKITSKDTVLEIGTGFGFLTLEVSKKSKKVITIDIEELFVPVLKQMFKNKKKIEFIQDDALKLLNKIKFDKLISNTPYAISEPLLQQLAGKEFDLAILTLPANFSKIITAEPSDKNYSKLSLFVQSFFKIKVIGDVPRKAFYPEPKTESSIIKIIPMSRSDYKKDKQKYIFRFLFLRSEMKLKNAFREALIDLNKKILGKNFTKRKSREIIKNLNLDEKTLNKKVNELKISELKEILDKIPATLL